MASRHGTRSRFVQGCTDGADGKACDACKKANNDYLKKRRQNKNAEKHGAKVATLPTAAAAPVDQPPEMGPNEKATLEELEGLTSAEVRPGLVQAALTLARVMDSTLAIAQHPAAAGRYADIMDKLRKGSEKKSRLSAVRAMTSPGVATG